MQLLAVKNVYGDEDDCLNSAFVRLLEDPPSGFLILDGNAGLGADWPAAIWKSTQALTIALAVFSAPSTIKENWPLWKDIFDSAVNLMLEFHGEFRIDRDSAQMIAMHHAVAVVGMKAENLNVHMAVRHFRQSGCSYQDLLVDDRFDMQWPDHGEHGSEEFSQGVQSNEEASKQAICRYIFGINDLETCRTIVVEQDGTVSLSVEL
jgi:hypothetical protein